VEKLDYLCFGADAPMDAFRAQLVDVVGSAAVASGARALTFGTADTDADIPNPPLLLGRGPELSAVASVWLDNLDGRGPIEAALRELVAQVDGYLVTESVPQPRTTPGGGVTHLTWFPKPDRLTDDEFFHGWHEVHSPSSFTLHPRRRGYVRDAVARAVTAGAPPIRAIVFEMFDPIEDYADPDRLYGSAEALERTMVELPLYADFESISSRPVHELVVI
jgi:hypothetical protein